MNEKSTRSSIGKNGKGKAKDIFREGDITTAAEVVSGSGKKMASEKHGLSSSRTYRSWQKMKDRCHNTNSDSYLYYGMRGIFVHAAWKESFLEFIKDMGERPEGTSIERKDVNGNYEPGNCIWATPSQQMRNTRRNKWVVVGGVRMTETDAAHRFGVSPTAMKKRRKHGERGISSSPYWLKRGEQNSMAKLTRERVIQLREDASNGSRPKDLIAKYGLSREQTRRIIRGQAWRENAMIP